MDPRIAILTIGTEIVSGLEADTNSHYLSKELFNHGFLVQKHLSVPDCLDNIVQAIRELAKDSRIIITTGGIGPTEDDLTREAVAAALNLPIEVDQKLFKAISERHVKDDHSKKMASFPTGASIIRPPKGLIGGFYLQKDGVLLISLPGVPGEIEAMLHGRILPILNQHFLPKIHSRRLLFKIANLSEVKIEERLSEIKGDYSYGLLPKLGEVHLYITVKSDSADDAGQKLHEIEKQVEHIYGKNLFAKEDQTLEQVVVDHLKNRGLTVSLAESSTGGLVASRITGIAGASKVFEGSFVTYSNSLKEALGVEKDLIIKHGAVSEEVGAAMADNMLKKANTDFAIAITGIAGPAGESKNKPVGLHYIAIATKGQDTIVNKFIFRGNRKQIQWQASQQALLMIIKEPVQTP